MYPFNTLFFIFQFRLIECDSFSPHFNPRTIRAIFAPTPPPLIRALDQIKHANQLWKHYPLINLLLLIHLLFILDFNFTGCGGCTTLHLIWWEWQTWYDQRFNSPKLTGCRDLVRVLLLSKGSQISFLGVTKRRLFWRLPFDFRLLGQLGYWFFHF